MPHWNGVVDGGSPPGYPSQDAPGFLTKLMQDMPGTLKLLRISWAPAHGDWYAEVTVAGDQTARADAEALFQKLGLNWNQVRTYLRSSEK